MKTANVAEAVKSEHAVALLKQMYGENRVEENAARYQLVADGFAKNSEIKPLNSSQHREEQRLVETIRITTTEKSWQEVYIWIVWQQQHPTEPTL